jgi:hypothetical protein
VEQVDNLPHKSTPSFAPTYARKGAPLQANRHPAHFCVAPPAGTRKSRG